MPIADLILHSARSQKISCVVLSKDCFSNSAAAADANAEQRFFLPLQRMSGSGAKGKSVRHTARQRPCSANAWYMVSNGNKNSAQGSEETFGFFRLFCPLFQLLGKVGRRRQNKNNPPRSQPRSISYKYSSIQSVLPPSGFPPFLGPRRSPAATSSAVCQPCWCQRRNMPLRYRQFSSFL